MNRIGCVVAAVLATGATAWGQTVVWLNVDKFPSDLETTGDAWSAIRAEFPDTSYRIAADDFTLEAQTRLTRIVFYGVEVGTPEILGGDWYIFTGPAEGPPTTLVAYGAGVPMTRTDSGLVNPAFGTVFENAMELDETLPAGHYFLAFRTYQTVDYSGPKNNNAALTTRVALGSSRAWWNFGVLGDGTVTDDWVLMEVFTLTPDHEWAFAIEGEPACRPDCDGNGTLSSLDVLCFLNAFNSGDDYADYDGNGTIDSLDFLLYLNDFNAGC